MDGFLSFRAAFTAAGGGVSARGQGLSCGPQGSGGLWEKQTEVAFFKNGNLFLEYTY